MTSETQQVGSKAERRRTLEMGKETQADGGGAALSMSRQRRN